MKNNLSITWILIGGLILRLILIAIGSYMDDNGSKSIHYTDIDYNVYSDGARLMWEGISPYQRSTYRYPPLIGFLMIPNIWFREFGKLLFSLADLLVVYQIYEISQHKCGNWSLMSWALNPLVANICTRGSLDSINNFLILSTLNSILKGHYVSSGLAYGLVVYLRLYPVIYFPALLLYSLTYSPPYLLRPQPQPQSQSQPPPTHHHQRFLSSNQLIINKEKSKQSHSHSQSESWIEKIHDLLNLLLPLPHLNLSPIQSILIPHSIQFVISSILAFLLPTLLSYSFYGQEYLHEAIFYHFGRTDPRHNFSPYFLWIYLCEINQHCLGGPLLFSILTTLPQIILFTLTTWTFAQRDLSVCFLILTFIFVTFNKVCTAQYFTWYACFLPLYVSKIVPNISNRYSLALMACWVGAVICWLNEAHKLEFLGLNNFYQIWLCSILFYLVNICCISFLISHCN